MKPLSPLQLRDYALTLLLVEANPEFTFPDSGETQSAIGVDFEIKTQKDKPIFRIDMDIWVNEQQEAFTAAPYRIHIQLFTILEFDSTVPKDDIPKLLGPNGLAMTYSIARGIVGQATGTSSHGKHILPTVNFIDLLKMKAKEMQQAPPPLPERRSSHSKPKALPRSRKK